MRSKTRSSPDQFGSRGARHPVRIKRSISLRSSAMLGQTLKPPVRPLLGFRPGRATVYCRKLGS